MSTAAELSTGAKLSTDLSKKTGMKREHSPYYPLKRKARGKENKPDAQGTGLSARGRVREPFRQVGVAAAVGDALRIFHGTRRNPKFDKCPDRDPCDERLWANFAWEFGYGKLLDLIDQAKAEIAEHRRPVPDRDKPKVLQALITRFWKRGAK